MINYSEILTLNYAGTQWVLHGEEYSSLEWFDSTPKPTQEKLDALWILMQETNKKTAYKDLRAKEYPPYTDYLDGIVKGDNTQVQAYIDACLAVKNKYPKGAAL